MQRVWFLLLPGFPVVDVAGAISVFEIANAVLGELKKKPFYRVRLIGAQAGAVLASSGVALAAEALPARIQGTIAKLIVAAGPWLRTTRDSDAGRAVIESWLDRMAPHIGSGATIGQEARTLVQEASRAAGASGSARAAAAPVHWSAVSVTHGVDLAMSLVAADLGGVIATAISSRMAAPFQRAYGFGSERGESAIEVQRDPRIADLLLWISMNLRRSYSVAQLAEHLAMSERTFARFYRGATGRTPAAVVQQIRVDAARRLLEGSHRSVKAIASQCGFASSEAMRRAFIRSLQLSPQQYRQIQATPRGHAETAHR
ncbi:helix-turn-helix domain-containing protein [Variovorax paradoxus]|nr:helix-turn-helix domain-containing protein [Variovorax paradoxus]MBT2305036.1 helix-turn-helix domain-containing protein [Variovorax paradoxus]